MLQQVSLYHWLRNGISVLFGRRSLGQRGEAAAAKYLRRLGYRILATGSRSALGELDLVALDGRTVVFVEVKTRQHAEQGRPVDAVDHDKQRRLTRLARAFLKRHKLLGHATRFDVIAVVWPPEARRPQIEHFRNAFEAAGGESFF